MANPAALLFEIARALTRPTLDLTLRAYPGLTTRIVEKPGLTLDETALAALVSALRAVAAKTLPNEALSYGVFSGARAPLERVIVTLISDSATGAPVAFNALTPMAVDHAGERLEVIHLGLVMVDPQARGQGLSAALYGFTTLLLFLRGGMRGFWISNVTQVPSVVGMVCETFSDAFPSPLPGARQSFAHRAMARAIMRDHRAVFGVGADASLDEGRGLIRNAYTGGSDALKKTFESAPKHRNPLFNDFCLQTLDYQRGDDVLQIARMDLAAARRYAATYAPPRSAPALAAAGAFLLLQSLILPIFYWLNSSARYGVLRSRKPAQ